MPLRCQTMRNIVIQWLLKPCLSWFVTVSLFLCSLSRVWWFFLLLMDYFDKLLLTAPLKNYRNIFSLSYLFYLFFFFHICLMVVCWIIPQNNITSSFTGLFLCYVFLLIFFFHSIWTHLINWYCLALSLAFLWFKKTKW